MTHQLPKQWPHMVQGAKEFLMVAALVGIGLFLIFTLPSWQQSVDSAWSWFLNFRGIWS